MYVEQMANNHVILYVEKNCSWPAPMTRSFHVLMSEDVIEVSSGYLYYKLKCYWSGGPSLSICSSCVSEYCKLDNKCPAILHLFL